jgi:hypothetical protein
MLPDILGNEVYKVLERDKLLNNVLVIFHTGFINCGSEIQSLLESGKSKIIHKPYTRAKLLNELEKA